MPGIGQHGRHARRGDLVGEPVPRERRVQRDVGAPGGEGAEDRGDRGGAVPGEQADELTRPDPGVEQPGGVPAGQLGQPGIGHHRVVLGNGDPVGRLPGDSRETVDAAGLRHRSESAPDGE